MIINYVTPLIGTEIDWYMFYRYPNNEFPCYVTYFMIKFLFNVFIMQINIGKHMKCLGTKIFLLSLVVNMHTSIFYCYIQQFYHCHVNHNKCLLRTYIYLKILK